MIAGNAAGTTIVVGDELVIGRHAEGAGKLSEDTEISRQHARVSREASGEYAIEDLGSSNGTFVNGLRIASPLLLSADDSIEVGGTTLVVRSIPSQTPPPSPPAPTGPGYAPTIFARAPAIEPTVPDTDERADAAPPPPAVEPIVLDGDVEAVVVPPPSTAEDTEVNRPASVKDTGTREPVNLRIPPLTLALEVDFQAREARIALGEDGQAVRLVFEDGRWQIPSADA